MIIRDIFSIMQTFAESTMNELLGWYGYDKVELRDSDASEIRSYPNRDRRQHVSVLKGESKGLMRRTVLHARVHSHQGPPGPRPHQLDILIEFNLIH